MLASLFYSWTLEHGFLKIEFTIGFYSFLIISWLLDIYYLIEDKFDEKTVITHISNDNIKKQILND